MTMMNPQFPHDILLDKAPRRLAYRANRSFETWRGELAEALTRCMGEQPVPVPLDPVWHEPELSDQISVRRVEFSPEENCRAVGWLVSPRDGREDAAKGPRPLIICLQGHTSGAHVSLGRTYHAEDSESIAGDRDFAIQAVCRGFHAFALEQRAFGERSDGRPLEARGHFDPGNPFTDERCRHQAMVALLLGRTLLGERVFDVRRAIDLLAGAPGIDASRIACVGNSGGGTVTYYAACLDERIAAVMPGCSLCTYADSIGRIDHCSDNYLPGALQYFDMADLSGLIYPRPMVVVAGREDDIHPYPGVTRAFDRVRSIYAAGRSQHKVRLFTGPGGHRFYGAAWDEFLDVTGW